MVDLLSLWHSVDRTGDTWLFKEPSMKEMMVQPWQTSEIIAWSALEGQRTGVRFNAAILNNVVHICLFSSAQQS